MVNQHIVVEVARRIRFIDDPKMRLYLPTTHSGEFVHPTKARALECWVYMPQQSREYPAPLNKMALCWGVLIHSDELRIGYSFYQSAININIGDLTDWLYHLHRCVELDLNLPTITLRGR